MTVLAFAGGSIQLVPDGTLLFHLFLIIVMVVVVNRTLLGPINRVLEERENRTKGRFAEARQALAAASERMAEHERRIREARAAGYRTLEEIRVAVSQETSQKIKAVKVEVGDWRDRQKAELKTTEQQVKTTLADEAKGRAAEISSRILGRSVSSRP